MFVRLAPVNRTVVSPYKAVPAWQANARPRRLCAPPMQMRIVADDTKKCKLFARKVESRWQPFVELPGI